MAPPVQRADETRDIIAVIFLGMRTSLVSHATERRIGAAIGAREAKLLCR
jgi:hypothetical protein